MTRNKVQGSILIIALWVLTILSLMATTISFYAMLQMKVVRLHVSQVQDRYLAQAGFTWAMNILVESDDGKYEALNQKWAVNPGSFKEKKMGDGIFSVAYTRSVPDAGLVTTFGFIDEESKININTAPKEVLMRLPEATEEAVASLIDWRDQDSAAQREGAEKDYYERLDVPYPSKDGPVEALEELLLVRGITKENWVKWNDLLTVYGSGKVNINTASKEVLKILGLEETLISKILLFRQGPDGVAGTEDDGVFKDEGSIARTLFQSEPINNAEVSQLVNGVSKGILGVQSKFFRIEALGTSGSSIKQGRRIIGVVEHIQKDEIKIKSWMEK